VPVIRSADWGKSWTVANNGLPSASEFPVHAFGVSGPELLAGTEGEGVFVSGDNGTTWSAATVGLTNGGILAFADSDPRVLVGTADGVFLSTNYGTSWAGGGLTGARVFTLSVSGTNVFAGTQYGGVFLSTNMGGDWTAVNTGLTTTDVRSLAIAGGNLFAGTYALASSIYEPNGVGLFKRPIAEMVTSVERGQNVLPTYISLEQNYPNPFNPSTTIRYGLPARSHLSLTVFNTLGQEVATLVNETEDAGFHDVRFDGTGLASGVYFYRLEAGNFIQTRELILLR
jgi:hypothetical protein